MAGWKAYAFVVINTLLYPGIFLYRHRVSGQHLPLVWLSILGLLYAWFLSAIAIPLFTSPLRHLPEPPNASYLFGHWRLLLSRPPGRRLLQCIKDTPNNGLVHFRIWAHSHSQLLPTSPETLAEVLNAHSYDWEKPKPARKFLSRVLGNGLIIVEGKEHKMQRKSVAPAFSGKHIRDLVPVFWEKSNDFCRAVAQGLENVHTTSSGLRSGQIEINAIAQRITLDIIGKAGLGKDFNTCFNSGDELAEQYAIILDPKKPAIVLYFLVNLLLPQSVVRKLPWKANKRIADAAWNLRLIARKLVSEKKAALQDKTVQELDILSVLIRSGSFDEEGLVNQLLTFLAAGHETTSSALTWATYLLSINPSIQQRLRAEIKQHLTKAESSEGVDANVIENMPLLSAVCNETLRLYPTVPLTAREAVRNTSIGDVVVPKGTHCIICPWAINRLESLWGPDAESFNPDRWLADGKAALGSSANLYSMLTFLHGPRSCIGQGFARSELKCLLACMVMHFDIQLARPEEANNIQPAGIITIKPKNGLDLRLTELPKDFGTSQGSG